MSKKNKDLDVLISLESEKNKCTEKVPEVVGKRQPWWTTVNFKLSQQKIFLKSNNEKQIMRDK